MNNGIVDISITKDEVVVSSVNFSDILVLGLFDASKTTPAFIERVRRYSSLDSMKTEGWSENDAVYQAMQAIFIQENRPAFAYVGKKLASAISAPTADPESVTDALNAIIDENDSWFGLVSTLKTEEEVEEVANFVEVQKKVYLASFSFSDLLDPNSTEDIATRLKEKKYNQTMILYHESAGTTGDEYLEAGLLAQGFSRELGSINWTTLPITGITPSKLSRDRQSYLDAKNVNYFIPVYNLSRMRLGKMIGGEWVDVVTGAYYLEVKLNEALADLLIRGYTKLGYTDEDIGAVRSVMEAQLIYFKNMKFIEKYIIKVPNASEISAQSKQKRELTGVEFEAQFTGAFNMVRVRGVLTNREIVVTQEVA